MQVSAEAKLSDSLVATGFPSDRNTALPINLRGVQAVAPKVRNIRVAGSAALHLAYVADGRLSGFWEIGLNSWDIAAGALLIQESGGKITDTSGKPYNLAVRNVIGSNSLMHDELQQELAAADATGF
jgi:myo-inositol-1(or 4)-monophosphatase